MGVLEAQRTGADRRWWPRANVRLPLRVVDTALTTTIQVDLPDGNVVTCEAMIAGGGEVADAWEYRLAFRDLEPAAAEALDRLVRAAAS